MSLLHTTRIVSITLSLLLGCSPALAQASIEHPSKGTVLAEYRSSAGPGMRLFGVDLGSDATLEVTRTRGEAFQVSLRTASGTSFTGIAGASVLVPGEHDSTGRLSLVQPFPFILAHYLEQLPAGTCVKEELPDGSTLYACTLISGSVATTIRGLPEGFTAATQQIDYTFGPDGRLHSIHRHSTGETEVLEYIDDAKNPKLAIPKSFANGGWILHNYEIYPEGRPDLFTPEAVTARAREMLIAFNERQEEMSQTPQAKRQLERSIEQLGGDSAPLRTTRLALILKGLIVTAVASIAWWKHRS